MFREGIDIRRFSFAGFLITTGIVFGDLGTSPLYTMRALINGGQKAIVNFSYWGGCPVYSGL